MSDSQSSGKNLQPPTDNPAAAEARASESSSHLTPSLHPISEQPTIISNRPPLSAPAISDSAWRIMEGRIMPGDRLGHFELVEYVGGGGMGRVFRATDTRLVRTVALKILPPDQAADPETLQRFQNEAQSAARLDHENIARVHYVGEDRGIHFIVFEFVEGENIRKLVDRKGPLPLDEAVSYTLQAVGALAHADARHVVHRDIKPSNLLITPTGHVKLIDMGLARLQLLDPTGADLTASGVTLGTFDYISPEQARDPRSADIRSDIYSLGCTFFFMLTGRPPFPQGTVLQKLLQHHGDPPPDVRQFRDDLPEEVNRIMQKMMAKDPRDRYPDPRELTNDLILLADQMGLQTAGPGGQPWLPKSIPPVSFFQRHLPSLASIAALVCIVLALHVFWNKSGPSERVSSTLPLGRNEFNAESLQSKSDLPESRANIESQGNSTIMPKSTEDNPSIVPSVGSAQESGKVSGAKTPQDLLKFYTSANPTTKAGSKTAESPSAAVQSSAKSSNDANPPAVNRPPHDSSHPAVSPGKGETSSPALDSAQGGSPRTTAGATSSTAVANLNASSPAEPGKRNALLIVSNVSAGENQFTTLAAACAAAHNGDVIELRYNGRRQEKPIHVVNLRATIRAGDGFQPVIVFKPNGTDPVKNPRSMFSLNSGRLTISNLALELIVPRNLPADNWSLLEIHGGQTVRLEKCLLTIANASEQMTAYHPDVVFFRVGASSGAETAVLRRRSRCAPSGYC